MYFCFTEGFKSCNSQGRTVTDLCGNAQKEMFPWVSPPCTLSIGRSKQLQSLSSHTMLTDKLWRNLGSSTRGQHTQRFTPSLCWVFLLSQLSQQKGTYVHTRTVLGRRAQACSAPCGSSRVLFRWPGQTIREQHVAWSSVQTHRLLLSSCYECLCLRLQGG